ncbi:adenosylcobinamide-GDP ribazoletransferase [Notoacmeibacter sp. MSK16QG-6]|uniref:adenosylcobinamide-GDP ribazoletransferase n=1 Tax=Notoacmeibacter sp. MSK16QG-6 TaxID=2957982 RepID=UPI00209FCF42|nr:adenosylcobinamide-GDP ribazoletransferase [Notoacmeibacter sp. MSK16QG-6]MCP1199796.1 adenosylcobinamide-GDP ribazoletransferase [Notoacmeibacter sp. MSK16QG-6]
MTGTPWKETAGGLATQLERSTDEALAAIGFYTRIPSWRLVSPDRATEFSNTQWAAPLAGIVIGLLLGMCNALFDAIDIADLPRGVLVIVAGLLLTGALHEDGLADVADGFGGGPDRERKLAIMKDSRLGAYGVLAMIASFLLRATLIAALTDPTVAALSLVAAHGAARALMPAMLHRLPNARGEGVACQIGHPSKAAVITALSIGFLALLPLGLIPLIVALIALAFVYGGMTALARWQIGGQTGDVCGTLEQIGEIAVLVLCATLLT